MPVLGAFLSQHLILIWSQGLSPLRIGSVDFVHLAALVSGGELPRYAMLLLAGVRWVVHAASNVSHTPVAAGAGLPGRASGGL